MPEDDNISQPITPDLAKGHQPKPLNEGHQPRQGTFGLRPPAAAIDTSNPPQGGSAIPPKSSTQDNSK